jgi:hypothetical protein
MPKIRQSTSQINFKNSASIDRVFTPVVSGPVNLVLNPSFTTNADGWTLGGFGTLNFRDTSAFRSAPASLKAQASGEFYQLGTLYTRNSVLTIGQRYSLSIWIRSSGGIPLTIRLGCGTNEATITETVPAGVFTNYKVENVLCSGNTNLYVSVNDNYSETGFCWIDDVSVVLGPTALVL